MKDFCWQVDDGPFVLNRLQSKEKFIQISKREPHVALEVQIENFVQQPTRSTLRKYALSSTKKITELLCDTCKIPL